jgi:hypothetical protein
MHAYHDWPLTTCRNGNLFSGSSLDQKAESRHIPEKSMMYVYKSDGLGGGRAFTK